MKKSDNKDSKPKKMTECRKDTSVAEKKPFIIEEDEPMRCEMSVIGVARFVRGLRKNSNLCRLEFDSIEGIVIGFVKYNNKNREMFEPKPVYIPNKNIIPKKVGIKIKRKYRVVTESIAKRILFISNECRAVRLRMERDMDSIEGRDQVVVAEVSNVLKTAEEDLEDIVTNIREVL